MSFRQTLKRALANRGISVSRSSAYGDRFKYLTAQQESLEALESALHSDPELRGLIAHLLETPHVGTSRLLSDRVALFLLGTGATFLEVGAWDPALHSDTRWLEDKHAWRGVQVEPNPVFADRLRRERQSVVVEAALVPEGDPGRRFFLHEGAMGSDTAYVSTKQSATPVATVTLRDLETYFPGGCDALFLDIEGYEVPIVTDPAFAEFGFQFVCVETIWHDVEIRQALQGHGYVEKWRFLSGYNSWFVKEPSDGPVSSQRP